MGKTLEELTGESARTQKRFCAVIPADAITTTEERVQFVRNRIAERRAFALDCREKAIGNTVSDAAKYLKLAELAEAQASAQETVLLVLFP